MILQPTTSGSSSPKIEGQVRQNKTVQNDRRPPEFDGCFTAPGEDHSLDTKEKLPSVREEEDANGGMVGLKGTAGVSYLVDDCDCNNVGRRNCGDKVKETGLRRRGILQFLFLRIFVMTYGSFDTKSLVRVRLVTIGLFTKS
jgi:hypothetical protein